MENLLKLVRAYLEESESQNRFIDFVLNKLEKDCSDINNISMLLNAMKNLNDSQYKYILLKNEITSPIDIVSVILHVRESSLYIDKALNQIKNMIKCSNNSIQVFNEIIDKVSSHSLYIVELMDDLLRTYLVNLPEKIQEVYFNKIEEKDLNQVLDSLGVTISNNPEDVAAKNVVDKLLNRKIEIIENKKPEEEEKLSVK